MRIPAFLFALTVAVTANAAITGSLVDTDSKPVAGATVRAYAAEGSDAMRARLMAGKLDRGEPVASAQSAENGSFSIELKTPAAVDLVIEAVSHNPTTITSVDGDDLGIIVLGHPPTRTVRITSGGKPVANAIVASASDVARTKASGEVPAGSGNYYVVHPDYAVARSAGGVTEIKLTRGVAVRGRVVKGTDPVAHAIVSINGWPLAETGDDGTFAIAHAPENWQTITAVHGSDAGLASRPKTASVEIRLGPGATFTGSLRDTKRGSAVAGARMTLVGPDDTSAVALSDAKGNFSFGTLLPRSYQLGGIHPAYVIELATVVLPATRSRALTAQPFARAKGHVFDEDKKPVAGAVVSTTSSGATRSRSSLTNAAGEFAVRVPPGLTFPLPLYASKRDYVGGMSPARVWQAGEVRDNIVITLARGFVAQVRVLDRRERPVPNAQVNVSHSASIGERTIPIGCADPSLPDCRHTNADGLVSVRTSEGRHDVMVFGDDVAPVRTPNQMLTARAATVVVHVDRGGEISGRVVLADGTPVAEAIVETPTGIMPRQGTTGSDGTFKITGIAPGPAMVTAFSSDRRLSSTPVSVTAPANDVTITMPRGARIEGRIFDRASQQPVTDFSILLPARGQQGVVRPDSLFAGGPAIHADDGRYALDNVPPGTLQLMVNATGYVAATRGDITVEDGKTVTGIDIALDRGANLSGRVTSAGAPVAGVQVHLAFQRTANFSNPTTDADGSYTMNGLAEGEHTIEFQKTGFVVLHKPVTITAGKDLRLDAELDPGRELRGRVVDHSGQPVAGANIATVGGDGRPLTMVASDGDGSFALQGLADGRYKVTARKEGFVSGEASDVVVPQTAALTLTMESGATINGRVTGLPPEQFTRVVVTASGNTSRNQTWVDTSGNFALTGMPDGRVRVDAFLEGNGQRRNATKTIMIENGVAPQVEMNFDEGITVSGHVTRASGPVTAGSVAFMGRMAPRAGSMPIDRQMINAVISPDGSYIATGLTAGDYDVRVNGPGLGYATKYTAATNGTFDIDIRGALLRGRVVDASTNVPVANAHVNVASRMPSFGSATTDSDGRFAVDALADATYSMQVSSDQYATASQQIVVSNGSVPDVEVRLEQAPGVIIHLVDATSGSPVDGNVAVADAAHRYSGTAVRIDNGTFKVWLKPGTYNANAYARGYISKALTITTPPAEVTIPISRGGALIIRARSAQQVRLDIPGGNTQRFLGPVQIGTNGPYDSLPPGSYLLSTVGNDRTVLRSMPVTIVPGETVTIDLP
jgi:large repetitive protein